MQQKKILQKKYFHLNKIDERDYSKIVWERKEKLDLFDKLIFNDCSEDRAFQAINVSRATYYRWKARFEKDEIAGLEPRSRFPIKIKTPEASLWVNLKKL